MSCTYHPAFQPILVSAWGLSSLPPVADNERWLRRHDTYELQECMGTYWRAKVYRDETRALARMGGALPRDCQRVAAHTDVACFSDEARERWISRGEL